MYNLSIYIERHKKPLKSQCCSLGGTGTSYIHVRCVTSVPTKLFSNSHVEGLGVGTAQSVQ
jgi:hypothetical protein